MADQTMMKPDEVRKLAKNFGQIGETLSGVNQALEILANTLKATAFIGLVGGGAVLAFIQMIKPYIKQMADKCKELNDDLMKSALAYERGDAEGATRFY